MKVIYDARWLPVDGKFDGVGRYSQELGNALAEQPGVTITWLVSDKRQLALLPKRPFIIANDPGNLWADWRRLPAVLAAEQPDIVYSPFFLASLARGNYKLIVTVHDTIYYHYRTPPHWLPWYVRLGWWLFHASRWPMRWLLRRADAVATVSDTTRQEITNWQLTTRPLGVVKNAVSAKFQAKPSSVDSPSRANSPIIVHHGAVTQYKNVELIIDALPLLPDVAFHMLGRVPAARLQALTARITARGVENQVTIHNGVSDEKLLDILGRCRCLLSPSRIEGFGLPVIEAQLRGTPVACSDTPIYREIAGDSVLYFDMNSPEQLAAAVNQLANPSVNRDYVARGLKNAQRFTWGSSAKAAVALYRRIL
ncbi:MAG: glycosyltransferase family 1 protein [Candidatus Saccharimonas sp.]